MRVLPNFIGDSLSWITASEKQQTPWADNKYAKAAQSVFNYGNYLLAGPEINTVASNADVLTKTWNWLQGTYQRGAILLKGEKPWEGPHGLRRVMIVAMRIAMVIAGAIALSAAFYCGGLGLQKAGAALITKAPKLISPYSQTCVGLLGKAALNTGIAANAVAQGLFSTIMIPTVIAYKGAVWGAQNGCSLAAVWTLKSCTWLNKEVLQPAGQFAWDRLPCLQESVATADFLVSQALAKINSLWV